MSRQVKSDIAKTRLNQEQRKRFDSIKKMLALTEDASALRACIDFTYNVTQDQFGGNIGQLFMRKGSRKQGIYQVDQG